MKKLILALALLLGGLNSVQAQKYLDYYDVWDVLVGGKLGGSAGLLSKQSCDPLWGPFGSIEAEMYLNPKISMSLEMSAAHKGADNVFTSPAVTITTSTAWTISTHRILSTTTCSASM